MLREGCFTSTPRRIELVFCRGELSHSVQAALASTGGTMSPGSGPELRVEAIAATNLQCGCRKGGQLAGGIEMMELEATEEC